MLSGVSQQNISRIEKGKQTPSVLMLLDLSVAMSLTVDDVLKRAGYLPGKLQGYRSGGLYKLIDMLSDDEQNRVREYAEWRLSEERAGYKADQDPDQG